MLNPMMMNVIMRTILKTDRNSFEDNIIKLKPKSEYRNDVFSNVIVFIFLTKKKLGLRKLENRL